MSETIHDDPLPGPEANTATLEQAESSDIALLDELLLKKGVYDPKDVATLQGMWRQIRFTDRFEELQFLEKLGLWIDANSEEQMFSQYDFPYSNWLMQQHDMFPPIELACSIHGLAVEIPMNFVRRSIRKLNGIPLHCRVLMGEPDVEALLGRPLS